MAAPFSLLRLLGLLVLLWKSDAWMATSFSITGGKQRQHEALSSTRLASQNVDDDNDARDKKEESPFTPSRRAALSSMVAGLVVTTTVPSLSLAITDVTVSGGEQQELFKLPSGLKYLELKQGTGPTPSYGQLCSIAYKGYIKLPANKDTGNPQPQLFGQSAGYLLKHGNGRTIAGLDQGLHTMRVGGTRRLIIPAKLGYTSTGLGPLPAQPWDRYRLNNLLDDMIKYQGGNLVFEVTLLSAIDDEADQGYYNDASLSPEDFETLRTNIQRKGQAAKATAAGAT